MRVLAYVATAVAILLVSDTARGEDEARVDRIDTTSAAGRLTAITDQAIVLAGAEGKQSVPRADAAQLVLAEAKDLLQPGRQVVVTSAGEELTAANVRVSDGKVRWESPLLGEVELPVASVRTLYLPAANQTVAAIRARMSEMKLDAARDTLIVAKTADNWIAVEGVLKAISADRISFRWKDSDRAIAADTVPAVRLAALEMPTVPSAGTVLGVDGSSLAFRSLAFADGVFVVESPTAGRRTLDAKKVAAVRFRSDRVTDLGDLTPARVVERGLLDARWPYRVGRSAAGKALRLDGRTYPTGLGLHSHCELTYDLGGQYVKLVALAGIDDAARPRGDATLSFEGDGKPLGKPLRLTGESPAQPVRLDVAGVKTLTIRVDFGEDKLDVGDQVDLAAARLIK